METNKTIEKNGLTFSLSLLKQKWEETNQSISSIVDFAYSFKPEYPTSPLQPRLKTSHTSDDVLEYAQKMKVYELESEYIKTAKAEYNMVFSVIETVLQEFICEEVGLNTIPEQYRKKVFSHAWESGHSSGWPEVYLHLQSLIEIFN